MGNDKQSRSSAWACSFGDWARPYPHVKYLTQKYPVFGWNANDIKENKVIMLCWNRGVPEYLEAKVPTKVRSPNYIKFLHSGARGACHSLLRSWTTRVQYLRCIRTDIVDPHVCETHASSFKNLSKLHICRGAHLGRNRTMRKISDIWKQYHNLKISITFKRHCGGQYSIFISRAF